ncbi:MAG: pyruvate, phosphate dikinase [Acholeplasmatales bacterium]|nr:pyruvate, phosphate dikinase [Acholeplasmatales bacterium]
MKKFVYDFHEGSKDMRALLGGKGANLAEMTNIGLPVPHGFTITTEACNDYYKNNGISAEIQAEIASHLKALEKETGKELGSKENPLLVSVRSGAPVSMPGMMDTVLNLGMNEDVLQSLIKKSGNKRWAYDSYRRFIEMFADVVMGYGREGFNKILDDYKNLKNAKQDIDLNGDDMEEITKQYKALFKKLAKEDFPLDPKVQLDLAIKAVFRSWNNERAIYYREMNDIPSSIGTAVNIQEMVYGNLGSDSGTGVAFTRDPATGENKLFGEYLINAQGEDVVAGIRTPSKIATLEKDMPEAYEQFKKVAQTLEKHYKDMQDMEFTIENRKLFMLQTRSGKRTGLAALKIAVDMVNSKMITKEEAIMRVDPKQLDQLLHPTFDLKSLKDGKVVAKGLPASPGAAVGKIYFDAKDVADRKKEKTILVRLETSPEDIVGMNFAQGVLTIRGGMTSHAAVVARGMGRCCVSGCSDFEIDTEAKTLKTKDGKIYHEGDTLSLDGSTGLVYDGAITLIPASISGDFKTFMTWADEIRTLKVKTNADTPKDAKQAREFGAEGIGLVRTEHMFFDEKRIFQIRRMITASTVEKREEALAKLLPMQESDFYGIFKEMAGYSVTIRLLDPPLHEFLPKKEEDIKELAKSLDMTYEALKMRIDSLHEFNPMMGHRGCRLDVTYPEIGRMQTRAIIEAAFKCIEEGIKVEPEIMVPLVGDKNELDFVKEIIDSEAEKIFKEKGKKIKYHVGTMIEIPRAAVLADEIAESAEFFSFGTNDLTQLTFGFSRDDAGKFLPDYYKNNVYEHDPFQRLDQHGVGKLMTLAVEGGRKTRPNIVLGICGEHGGEASSIDFCHRLGLNYVSCSPYRVPLARLAAAQAAVRNKK